MFCVFQILKAKRTTGCQLVRIKRVHVCSSLHMYFRSGSPSPFLDVNWKYLHWEFCQRFYLFWGRKTNKARKAKSKNGWQTLWNYASVIAVLCTCTSRGSPSHVMNVLPFQDFTDTRERKLPTGGSTGFPTWQAFAHLIWTAKGVPWAILHPVIRAI